MHAMNQWLIAIKMYVGELDLVLGEINEIKERFLYYLLQWDYNTKPKPRINFDSILIRKGIKFILVTIM